MAEFSNDKQCAFVPLIQLNLCPTYWSITILKQISVISIQGLWSPKLSINWDEFKIKSKLNDIIFLIKPQVQTSIRKARHIRQILGTPYCVYFYIKNKKLLIPLK